MNDESPFRVGEVLDSNGALVVACRKHGFNSFVVLALQPNASVAHDPYVTWIGFPEGGTSWGHYYDNFADAAADFNER